MSDETGPTAKRFRSPNFPAFSLPEAVAKAKVIWEKENRHSLPADVAIKHWKKSPTSSGAKQLLAAVLSFGLLSESGNGSARTVKLTERALNILLGDEVASKAALKEAALLPAVYKNLFEEFGATPLPSDETLSRRLVLGLRFNPAAVQGVIKDYKETLEFSGLMAENSADLPPPEDDEEELPPPPPPPADGVPKHREPSGFTPPPPPPAGNRPPAPNLPTMNAETMLPIPMDNGLSAYIPRGISEDDFEVLLESLKLWKRKIVAPEWPKRAMWSNADNDQPVTITGPMGEKDGVKYYRSTTGTGIPEHELTFPG